MNFVGYSDLNLLIKEESNNRSDYLYITADKNEASVKMKLMIY